jgi:16S rRNA (guanine1516-N2)-methyltransferase
MKKLDIDIKTNDLSISNALLSQAKALGISQSTAHVPADFTLIVNDTGLSLISTHENWTPLSIDFNDYANSTRAKQFGKQQALAKAIGLNKKSGLTVLDTTAGLGRDAYLLAKAGANVVMIEQHPALFLMLSHAIKTQDTTDFKGVLSIYHGQSVDYLNDTDFLDAQAIDVIYCDPMFAKRQKSAKVKKDMQLLQALIGHSQNNDNLLKSALSVTQKRVVVKRPRLGDPISSPRSQTSIMGKTHRFDVYQPINVKQS